jgi:hypothetical protein
VLLVIITGFYTYYAAGQLHNMKRATGAPERSATAAKSAADTADAPLKNQQKSFEIDQRPYMVVEGAPRFSGNGLMAQKGITVNIAFRDVGRTPAMKFIGTVTQLAAAENAASLRGD